VALDPSGLCKVEVVYFPIRLPGLGFKTGKYHAAVVVSNNTGGPPNPWIYRGGPGPGGTYWTPNLAGTAVPFNDPSNPDPPSQVAKSQTLLDDGSDCKCITSALDNYYSRVNNSNIPYHLPSTNSNAFASGAVGATGLQLPAPPVPVPGWGTPLPVKGP